MNALLAAHCAATWALVGLIWTVQLVLYPLFGQVSAESFHKYHACHKRNITLVVAPLMLAELFTAVFLFIRGAREPWLLASFVPLLFNWFSTWRVQIPLHDRLADGFDSATHGRLVASNWWRTLAWTLRGGCLIVVVL